MTNCDNDRCEHNKNYICSLNDRSIVDCTCVSRRKKQQEENYSELMKSSKPKGYKRKGKWVHN